MKTLYLSDLDGTLLTRDSRVPPKTVELLNQLVKDGICFTYATARSFSSAKVVTKGLQLTYPISVYNGGMLIDPSSGEMLHLASFEQPENEKIARISKQVGIYPLVYAFVDKIERVSYIQESENDGLLHYLKSRPGDKRFRQVDSLEELFAGDAFHYTYIGTKDELTPLHQAFSDAPNIDTIFQQELYRPEFWCELQPTAARKSNGAIRLKKLLGCDKLVVFGDGINDLPMFEAADECYAVENAVPALKEVATGILKSNEKNGVADWLVRNAEI